MSAEVKNIYPRIDVARGKTVCMRTFADSCNVLVEMWEGAKPRDKYRLTIWYAYDESLDEIQEEVYSDILPQGDIESGVLKVPLQKQWFDKVLDSSKIGLVFYAHIDGVEKTFNFVSQIVMKDYTLLSYFRPNFFDRWTLGERVDPAKVTWDTYQGKPCFSYRVDNSFRHTIISKDLSLVSGAKYLCEAHCYLPGSGPIEVTILGLADGARSSLWHANINNQRVYNIIFGITGRQEITTLRLVAGGGVTTESCLIQVIEFSVCPYVSSGGITWNPEWDKEYASEEDVPVLEPEADEQSR